MNRILEYTLSLRDRLSSAMNAAGATTERVDKKVGGLKNTIEKTFNNAPGLLQKTADKLRSIAPAANEVDRSLRNVEGRLRSIRNTGPADGVIKGFNAVKREIAAVNKEIEKTSSNSMGDKLLARLGRRLAMAASFTAILAFGKSAVAADQRYEQTSRSFEILAQNQGIGRTLSDELNTLQQKTVLGPEVFKAAQTMMGFGMTAEKVIPTMRMLGDVSMGNAERMQSLTLAYSQVQAAGRLMGQDLLQFINAGFNPLQEISKRTGVSIGDLKKKMEEGAISAGMVTEAFKSASGQGGIFNNMLEKMAETGGGKMAQLQGSFEAMKIAIGERMRPAVSWFIGGLTAITDRVKRWFEIPLSDKINEQINRIRSLQAELTATNTKHERQLQLLNQLEQINPRLVEGIDRQSISYSKLSENINNVTGALKSKLFLERFDKDNASVLDKYSSANRKLDESFATVMNLVGRFPDIAQDPTMTIGQKQAAAMQRQRQIVEGMTGKGITTHSDPYSVKVKEHPELATLKEAQKALSTHRKNSEVIRSLAPQITQINASREALVSQIDKYTGIKAMTGAKVPGAAVGGNTSTSGTLSDLRNETNKSVSTGGSKNVTIHITIGKQIESLTVMTQTVKEGAERIREIIVDEMTRAIAMGQGVSE